MHSPRSSSASAFLPQQSPLMASQQSGRMLPSPTSINFPHSQLPPLASPHASAHSVHLQDLQHQVSIKTLALQTLRSEYDSLLQKLERQRTKCATLEKKFEVTDVEINSLTDERERLQAQVISLEAQVEDLQKSRDEAKRQLVTNGAQYMKIVDMANQLQAKCADDRRKWAIEKEALDEKIRGLEDAMVAGVTGREPTTADDAQPSAPSSGAIRVLKVEIARLRAKNQMMDLALKTMKEECHTMQVTLQAVVNSGQKIQQAADTVIGSENR
ncbi:hypothetical protein M501DRAFT_937094 [Patellaria atrata CBS 101060]|uniref:Uncharacterized protein n=1 Tax=Patellaria atrata CBS 101060 TaxID=1346257 RepID=A0A9P4S8R5_9PEZI|nr:hypothetical protein M501DRAFT_937094 [Patellaria atrata CBS 101060]